MDKYIYLTIEKKFQEYCKNNKIKTVCPSYWYKISDYKLKSNILYESMKENISIEKTKSYQILLDKFKNIIV